MQCALFKRSVGIDLSGAFMISVKMSVASVKRWATDSSLAAKVGRTNMQSKMSGHTAAFIDVFKRNNLDGGEANWRRSRFPARSQAFRTNVLNIVSQQLPALFQ
jgi:hypothetical protein